MTQEDGDNFKEDADSARNLRNWLEEHSIYVHPDVQICCNGHAGSDVHVRVKSGVLLHPPTVIGIISKSVILSPRTSALSYYFTRKDWSFFFSPQATCGLLLSTCLLYEVLLGAKSRWYGYIQSLPSARFVHGQTTLGISLPLEWRKDSLAWRTIEHCEAGRLIQRAERRRSLPTTQADHVSLNDLKVFFNNEAYPLLRSTDIFSGIDIGVVTDSSSLEALFIGCYTLVSSRAFICDTYHGLALCPFADAFNHADYGENQVQFECNDEAPFSSAALSHEDTIHMSMTSSVCGSDPELYNSYGPLSNATLLTRYGFALEDETDSERFTWDWRDEVERHEMIRCLFADGQEDRLIGATTSDPNLDGRIQKWIRRIGVVCDNAGMTHEVLLTSHHQPQEPATTTSCDTHTLPPLPCPSPFSRLASLDLHHDAETIETLASVFVQPASGARRKAHDFESDSPHVDEDGDGDSLADSSEVDAHLPFYVDGEGRISLALWRAVVLACVPQDDSDLKEVLRRTEQLAAATIVDEEPGSHSAAGENETESTSAHSSAVPYKLLRSALCILEKLLSSRISRLAVSPLQGQTDTEEGTYTQQQHAARHFYQEKSIMDIALHQVHSMQCTMSRDIN